MHIKHLACSFSAKFIQKYGRFLFYMYTIVDTVVVEQFIKKCIKYCFWVSSKSA